MSGYLKWNQLKVGDIITVDPNHGDKYEVVEVGVQISGVRGVLCEHTETEEREFFGGSVSAYSPDFVLHER